MIKKNFLDAIKREWFFYICIMGIALLVISSFFSCGVKRYKFIATLGGEPKIRVLLQQDVEFFELNIKSKFGIYDIYTNEKKLISNSVPSVMVKPQMSGIQIGTKIVHCPRIKIVPYEDGSIYVNGVGYRGELHIFNIDGKLSCVNVLPVEEYIAGIDEMPQKWDIETLCAQVIAARTYAIYKIKKIGGSGLCDVLATIKDQCYRGLKSESGITRKIVSQTRGLVLVYPPENWMIFPAFYHSTCAGKTIPANRIWEDEPDILPLSGVKCEFCQDAPRYRWKKVFTKNEIKNKIMRSGRKISDIKKILLEKFQRAARVKEVKIILARGSPLMLKANEFRQIIGTNDLLSTFFTIRDLGKSIEFKGKGWGHGVGMCQWGAYGMAKKGYSAEQILSYYYPGSEIVRIYE